MTPVLLLADDSGWGILALDQLGNNSPFSHRAVPRLLEDLYSCVSLLLAWVGEIPKNGSKRDYSAPREACPLLPDRRRFVEDLRVHQYSHCQVNAKGTYQQKQQC